MKRITGYVLLSITLSACALFPSTFDAQEHARIVDIYQTSKNRSVCINRDLAQSTAENMARDAEWLYVYGAPQPNNEKMANMERNLRDITKELADRYYKPEPVSRFYCEQKFENINRATKIMLEVSARRPRL